jgi:hypothetical protein
VDEAGILETATNMHGLAMGAMVFYLSIVSGYLVVAHFAGSSLTRFQVSFITSLFVAFSVFASWGSVAYFQYGSHFLLRTAAYQELRTEELVSPAIVIGIVEVLGIIGCLAFMHGARKPPS